MHSPLKIAAIGGSLRAEGWTYAILKLALEHLQNKGIDTKLLDLRELNLPFCHGGDDYLSTPVVEQFRNEVQSSHGVLLVTPEYHGSMSGVLKNALDLIENRHIEGKVIALIAVTGGAHSTNALNTLRLICRHLHAWVLPEQLVIADVAGAFDSEGNLINKRLIEKLENLMEKFAKAVKVFSLNS